MNSRDVFDIASAVCGVALICLLPVGGIWVAHEIMKEPVTQYDIRLTRPDGVVHKTMTVRSRGRPWVVADPQTGNLRVGGVVAPTGWLIEVIQPAEEIDAQSVR